MVCTEWRCIFCRHSKCRIPHTSCIFHKVQRSKDRGFLISNFHCVLYVVCFLLGNSPASEFYMSTFRNTVCSIFIGK
jgi:hypothetical protein